MARTRPTTVAAYIRGAPREGQPYLRKLYKILRSVAPDADAVIKWGNPFFIKSRCLFAFSAHKAHLSFAPDAEALQRFRKELKKLWHRLLRRSASGTLCHADGA